MQTKQLFNILEIIFALIVLVCVLIQSKGVGISPTFGGMGGSLYRSKRGFERFVFILTIVAAILFVVNSMVILLLR